MNSRDLAPIVLFVYNRPDHTKQTLEALSRNDMADQSTLYVYADGPKSGLSVEALLAIKETRAILRSKLWCKEVIIIESDKNLGLADSIIRGVTEVVNNHNKVIVLEDDLVTSSGFLKYMNSALNIYQENESVMHVSGYMYPVSKRLEKKTVFLKILSCWGWATWKRAWKYYSGDTESHIKYLSTEKEIRRFNILGNGPFYKQLQDNYYGRINSWAVKWYASWYFKNGYSLFPQTTLVTNIGHDGTGVHCSTDLHYAPNLIATEIEVIRQQVIEDKRYLKLIDNFYKKIKKPSKPFFARIIFRLKRFFLKGIKSLVQS